MHQRAMVLAGIVIFIWASSFAGIKASLLGGYTHWPCTCGNNFQFVDLVHSLFTKIKKAPIVEVETILVPKSSTKGA